MPILQTHNLTIGYSSKKERTEVLSHLNLSLHRGEVVCLIGANGKGKSTLLRTLAGTQPPLAGGVEIDGTLIASLPKAQLALLMSIVYTDRTSTGALTVKELVGLGRQPHTGFFGRLSQHDKTVVEESMANAGIIHKRDSLCAQLSDGERQKAMIAKALAQHTPIIFLDEPTAFLDVASKIDTMQLLHNLAVEQNKAVLLSTHDISQALMLADRIWLIDSLGNLTTGYTEDLILNGSLNSLFNSHSIQFDPLSGAFSRQCNGNRTVTINEGDSIVARWCANAMSRNNIAINNNSPVVITPIAHNHITIHTGNRQELATSIEQLTSIVLKYFNNYGTE